MVGIPTMDPTHPLNTTTETTTTAPVTIPATILVPTVKVTVASLRAACMAKGLKGYSSMSKGALISFLETGVKPVKVVKDGSAADLRAQAKVHKANGLIDGPISSLKVADLRTAVDSAKSGTVVKVVKPAAKEGTANYNRELLRNMTGVDVLARAKKEFGVCTSKLRAAQLAKLVAILTPSSAAA